MQSFISSGVSSSSGSSGRAEQPAVSLRSAELPASIIHISSLRDVQRWLAKEHVSNCSSADVQRIREAVTVLSHPKPKQEDVRPLQSKWQVAQQIKKKPKPLADVIHELQEKVVKAAQKLHQELIDSAEQPASTTFVQNTANISNACESALLSPDGAEELLPAFDQILANLKER